MKKILILGGANAQIPAIQAAKEMGHYVITCDYIPENPGHKMADEYYNISTTDRCEVLQLSMNLGIDGIVCYASDPAATTAAYVSEAMGFPTSPLESVEILSNKEKFREFQKKNGFNCPEVEAYKYKDIARALDDYRRNVRPVMIKPVDSSGSKGINCVKRYEDFERAVYDASKYTRNEKFIVEDIVCNNGYQLAGDGYSVDGRLVFRCFSDDHFDVYSKKIFSPVAETWPCSLDLHMQMRVHDELQRVLSLLNMKTQAYNFEVRINEEDIYIMEIGPRSGGNGMPLAIKYATGVDIAELVIRDSLGEPHEELKMLEPKGFWGTYMLHSNASGIMHGIKYNDRFVRENLVEIDYIKHEGDIIEKFTGANTAIGTAILKFDSKKRMDEVMECIEDLYEVIVK